MAVYDRWHKSYPKPDEPLCREHKLVPSASHGVGDRWQVRWDVTVNGKRQQPKRNFRLKKEADEFDAEKKAELKANQYSQAIDAETVTVTSLGHEWLDSMIVDEMSLYTMEMRLKNHVFTEWFGNLRIVDLHKDPMLIQQWIKGLHQTLAQNTVRAIALHLSSMLNLAVYRSIIPSNPMKGNPLIKIPSRHKRVVMPYTAEQLRLLEEVIKEEYRLVIKVGAGLGLRIGEIFGLSPDDIQGDEVHIRRQVKFLTRYNTTVFDLPKGDKTRIVPLPKTVGDFLADQSSSLVTYPWKAIEGKATTVRLFMARNRRGFGVKAVTNKWNAAFKKAGITRLPREDMFHKLRHTYASRLLKAGVDIRSLAQYLGHDDPGFTLRTYCHFMLGTGDEARRAIDGDVPRM